MLTWWLTLLLGAILGHVVSKFLTKITEYISEARIKREKQKRKIYFSGSALYDWLLEYYSRQCKIEDLYKCKTERLEMRLPFLTKKEWLFEYPLTESLDDFICFNEEHPKPIEIDEKLFKYRRKKLGQRLFDNPTLYLFNIEEMLCEKLPLKLHVNECSFFAAFTKLGHLEEETYHAIRARRYTRLPIRDKFYSNINVVSKAEYCTNIAGACILALKTENSYDILIATRSEAVIAFPGAKAVVPMFGLVPVVSDEAFRPEFNKFNFEINLLYYNFLKEYLEELFNYEDIIENMNARQSTPLWFYDLDEAKTLREGIESGKISFRASRKIDFYSFHCVG